MQFWQSWLAHQGQSVNLTNFEAAKEYTDMQHSTQYMNSQTPFNCAGIFESSNLISV